MKAVGSAEGDGDRRKVKENGEEGVVGRIGSVARVWRGAMRRRGEGLM